MRSYIIIVAVVRVVPHLFHHDGEAHGIHLSALAAGKGLHDDMLGAVDDDLRGLHLAHPLVVQDAVLGTQDPQLAGAEGLASVCLLYTSDAADEL